MQNQKYIFGLSSVTLVIILGAVVKFALHMYMAPGYGFFGDELYTIALSKHLAFGYVDLPPLVPVLVALSRALLGESLFAMHIVPALAGSATLVFVCLIAKEFGGKTFAVMLSAMGFIFAPLWLSLNSIFCYDSIDQLVLAGFPLYARPISAERKQATLDPVGFDRGCGLHDENDHPVSGTRFFGCTIGFEIQEGFIDALALVGGSTLRGSRLTVSVLANRQPLANARILEQLWHIAGVSGFPPAVSHEYSYLYESVFPAPMDRRTVPHLSPVERRELRFPGCAVPGHPGNRVYFARATIRMLAELFIPLIAAGAVFVEEKVWPEYAGENGLKTAATALPVGHRRLYTPNEPAHPAAGSVSNPFMVKLANLCISP